jgi:hypothetical protein
MEKPAGRPAPTVRERFADLSGGSLVWKVTILVALAGVMRIALRPAQIQHDVAMYLQAGQLLLRGQRPYVDFVDLNPPLIIYLSAIPAAVARGLGTHVVPTAMLLVACAASLSLFFTRRILVGAFEEAGADGLLADLAVLALAYAFFWIDAPELIDVPYPGNAPPDPRLSEFFGQREHLFMLAAAPFVALRFRRWEGGAIGVWTAVVVGGAASLFTCLKPQFLLVIVPFEIALFASKRKLEALRAPELAAFSSVVIAYALHFAFLPEAVKDAWFRRWLPLTIAGYGVFDEPHPWRLVVRCWPAALALVAAFALTPVDDPKGASLTRGFALMALGGAVLYVAQRKGWTYHAYPFRACSTVVAACALGSASAFGSSDDRRGRRFPLPVTRRRLGQALAAFVGAFGLACIVCLARIDMTKDIARLRDHSPVLRTIDSLTGPGDSVLVATTTVWYAYPALTLLHRDPGSRYLWLFPIAMMQAAGAAKAQVEDDFVRDLATDIRERHPRLLLLQTGHCYGCGKSSVDSFFQEHPALATALEDYSSRGTLRDGDAFQVLVRP